MNTYSQNAATILFTFLWALCFSPNVHPVDSTLNNSTQLSPCEADNRCAIKKSKSSNFWDKKPYSPLKVNVHRTIWRYIPEDRNVHNHGCDSLKFKKFVVFCRTHGFITAFVTARHWIVSRENSVIPPSSHTL
jgi:hypothetical protein